MLHVGINICSVDDKAVLIEKDKRKKTKVAFCL